jgi:hypothetical protein
MRTRLMVALALLASAPALLGSAAMAAEPSGCDKFKWPIERERAALTAPDRARLASGAELPGLTGITLSLTPPAEAKLPSPPERKPKDGTFAGFVSFKAPHKAGAYTISLSDGAWIDVVQDDAFQKPIEFSGATDCAGIRKTIKVDLSAGPFVIQISGAADKAISLAVLPSD